MKEKFKKGTPQEKEIFFFGWKKVLFVGGETLDNNFMLALKNIINSDALPSQGANVYDILKHDTLVLTKDAVENLTKRLSK